MAKIEREIQITVKGLEDLMEQSKCYNQARQTLKIIQGERIKNVILESKFRRKYGLQDKTDLLPTLLQYFYEMGLEDAKAQIKESL